MTADVQGTIGELRRAAAKRMDHRYSGKTRVVVQVGHCSGAVGAHEVVESLADTFSTRPDLELVIAGCDGACFNAPQVLVTPPGEDTLRFGRVSREDARKLAEALLAQPPTLPLSPLGKGGLGGVDSDPLSEFFDGQQRLVLHGCGDSDPTDLDGYLAAGGYQAQADALDMGPEAVIERVADAGLLGRGGAYFPAARKWQGARAVDRTPRYVVVNCEEGEPGIFKDRHLMEGTPHRLLEGLIIAAYASGTEKAYIYINAEAHLSAQRVEGALAQARERNLVGDDILGSGFSLDVEVRRGAGGYVCGEETTLLNTIEGDRRVPRLRPPFPVEAGLWSNPTVINNAETLANVPFLVGDGPSRSEFMEAGLESARGTKLICLSGAVQRPGLVEVPMGTTLRHVIHGVGGGPPPGRDIGAVVVGGPSSGVLPVSMLDTALRPGMLHESGVVMGAGGVVVVDEGIPVVEVVRRLAAYNAAESCGKCTPCREGTPRMVEALDRLAAGQGSAADLDDLKYLAEVVGAASLCGLGQMAGGPINSALHFFAEDMGKLARVKG